jgi:hypothetical protein
MIDRTLERAAQNWQPWWRSGFSCLWSGRPLPDEAAKNDPPDAALQRAYDQDTPDALATGTLAGRPRALYGQA